MGITNARALVALGLMGFAGFAQAQFEPDADTAALYHFDTQTAEGTTPDAGPNGLDGTLEGAVLPTHVEATLGGFGWAYQFDGVDRGANNSRINMGTNASVGLRGNGDWTLDVLVTVTSTLVDDGYFRGIVCRASSEGIDYSVSYVSWTSPGQGPLHEFWFTSGSPADYPTGYPYTALAFTGRMEVNDTYAIRAMVSNGVMTLTVNGQSVSTVGQTQPAVVPPTLLPVTADLTVGDACLEDNVVKPSELQIDELHISNAARTDLPLLPLPETATVLGMPAPRAGPDRLTAPSSLAPALHR